ncbi:FAM58A family protein [Megaselia abdita]
MLKNVVDCQNMPSTSRLRTNYRKQSGDGICARYLFECSIKLSMKPLTSATAAILFHRFFKEVKASDYDEYLIAASCLYLAGKIKDEMIKIRDVINVTHNTLHRDSPPLELGDEYWSIRDAIVQAELLITRMLKYDLSIELPHKYLLYYLKSLKDWLGNETWETIPIAKSSAAYLQDFHHSPEILKFQPNEVAVCALSLALQTYGVQIPLTEEGDDSQLWYHVFCKDLTKERHWNIIECIMEVYNKDAELNAL